MCINKVVGYRTFTFHILIHFLLLPNFKRYIIIKQDVYLLPQVLANNSL